jgi:hypothetical protein
MPKIRTNYTPDTGDVPNTETWGGATAEQRYGRPRFEYPKGAPEPPDHSEPQALGDTTGAAGNRPRGFENDVPADSWLRSDGTAKPAFDKQNAWRGGKLRD